MKITGLTRIRNESAIINDTLDHMSEFCNEVYVYDDASTDNTREICHQHQIVSGLLENSNWDANRAKAETESRKALLEMARQFSSDTDWFVYMDADERIEFDWKKLEKLPGHINGIRMKLFDFYITAEDVDQPYTKRRWIGPEYRNILMAFRNIPDLKYIKPDQRSPIVPGKIIVDGFVKHYGKAVSVEQWEETCDYYANHFPKYASKWKARKGKAVHTRSDFGRPMITWKQKEQKGIKLY